VVRPLPPSGTVLAGEECLGAQIVTENCIYAGRIGPEANGEKTSFQPLFAGIQRIPTGWPKNSRTEHLKAGLVNVIYPPYQTAESFGR
jgi:hypothetical protein